MKITVRPAQPADAYGLSFIDSLCTQGKSLVYHYKRDNFFARSRVYNKWTVFVAEAGNTLVGMVSACIKNVKIAGRFVPVGYIYDLRVHPSWRGQWISYKLLGQVEDYLRNEKANYAYTYVLGVNTTTKMAGKVMGMHYSGEYRALMFPCFQGPGTEVRLVSGTELQNLLPEIKKAIAHYDLKEKSPVSVQYKEPVPGSPFLGTFRLSGSSDTTAGVWDSSVFSTKVIDKVPLPLQILNKMGRWLPKTFKVPHIPGTGEKLILWHLIDIRQESDNPVALKHFVRGMQVYAGNRGVHILMIHLDIKDPLYRVLKKKAFFSIGGHVLMRTPIAGELPPVLNCIYLDVRDF